MMTADVYASANRDPTYATAVAGQWMASSAMQNGGCTKFSSTSSISTNGPGPPTNVASLNASAYHQAMMENYYNSHSYGQQLLIKSGKVVRYGGGCV